MERDFKGLGGTRTPPSPQRQSCGERGREDHLEAVSLRQSQVSVQQVRGDPEKHLNRGICV